MTELHAFLLVEIILRQEPVEDLQLFIRQLYLYLSG